MKENNIIREFLIVIYSFRNIKDYYDFLIILIFFISCCFCFFPVKKYNRNNKEQLF